jgi:hypothetical protein
VYLHNRKVTLILVWLGSTRVFLSHQPLVPLLLVGPPFFWIILFMSNALITGITASSLRMHGL